MWERPNRSMLDVWLRDLETIAKSRGFSCARWGSSAGLPLLGFTRAAAQEAPRIYLSAGIHGDEPAGPQAIDWLLRKDRLDRRVGWTVCPLLNPGGWLGGTREGPCGRDHNRDYLNPQTAETAAHCAWIDRCVPHELYLSLHEDWEATGFYLYEINTSEKRGFAKAILERVSQVIEIEPGRSIDDHDVCAPGYIAHEPEPDEPLRWPEAIYHCKRYSLLSYTFETPSSLPLAQRVAALVIAAETAVEEFLRRGKTSRKARELDDECFQD